MSYDKINNKYNFTTQSIVDSIMKNVEEALVHPRWKDTINEDMKALNKNQT